ncbi:Acetyl-CoA hydrolase/transferase C-terminal domain-containing protein [Thermosyntropha lipolytica DSM 11003]|uniref:Acetyl-CoA hydrolase/transferase C-terminal domain-containing protein n=2 Tax=Thermosyntropha TaxID=54293 RepID=A0A1M5JHQ6_9FIRM|nr:acetyl-CoA hydrolase/transferase C-terminal domain-containing protein [Thermosyntropha lipolytica]SHG40071.1 Acetyl-CoA hydrolase/transferase C-terminal domain-containing protein [Thermosyntropha lipolytica DSM 11003]
MQLNAGVITDDVKKCVDEIINYIGKDITFAMTLALGKPARLVNELYRRAKEDPELKLRIVTALSLEKPRGHSEIERRFLKPIADRIFDGVPDFEYIIDYREGRLPPNVEIYEFFCKAGANLHSPELQQNHLASNYTHVPRDAVDFGTNVLGVLLAPGEIDGQKVYSTACNPDVTLEAIELLMEKRKNGEKVAIIGEVNANMPFMYGDAVVTGDNFDYILEGPYYNYALFAPPKDAVAFSDYSIGLHASTLVKDGGTIQVGIGALGDAIVYGLIMRNDHNDVYREIISKMGIDQKYGKLIEKVGGLGTLEKGLYGSSEMFIDAFMQMYKNGILKRKVYDSIPLMKLINAGELDENNIREDIIDKLLEMKAINPRLTDEDFRFLTYFGILKPGLQFSSEGIILDGDVQYSADLTDEKARREIRKILGKRLLNGYVMLGAFFIGPKSFYDALNNMSEEERKLFQMSGVRRVNQLYGDEELRKLQRKDARFINTGMIATLLGAVASDQLEDGRVVSGIGGQYNFVAMAHALPDARAILLIKSTKGTGRTLKSNIRFSYGHCSVPKHLRDIIVTEYGIADVRGKPHKEVVMEMLKVADSRFQDQLLEEAKKAKLIPKNWDIPAEYRQNTPERIASVLAPYQKQGYFKPHPYGTDLTQDEIILGGSLKALKALSTGYPLKMASGLFLELFRPVPKAAERYLELVDLARPKGVKERILRKLVVFALRNNKRI